MVNPRVLNQIQIIKKKICRRIKFTLHLNKCLMRISFTPGLTGNNKLSFFSVLVFSIFEIEKIPSKWKQTKRQHEKRMRSVSVMNDALMWFESDLIVCRPCWNCTHENTILVFLLWANVTIVNWSIGDHFVVHCE